MDITRQSACVVVNPVMVYSYSFLFNCMTVGHASDDTNIKPSLVGCCLMLALAGPTVALPEV